MSKLRDTIVETAADLSREEPFWTAGMLADALIERGVMVQVPLGDLPSRIQGWIGKARAQGRDRIELNFDTVERLMKAVRGVEE